MHRSSLLSHLHVDSFARWAAAIAAFALPFHGLGGERAVERLGLAPSSVAYLAASPFLVAAIVRRRAALVRSQLALSVVAFALVQAATNAQAFDTSGDVRAIVRDCLFAVVVLGLGVVTAIPAGRRTVECALIAGGFVSVTISLLGYVASLLLSSPPPFIAGFHFSSPNNVVGGLARLTGTSGHAPEHMGEYLVLLLAVLWSRRIAGDTSRGTKTLIVLAALSLALTLSWAWIGGLALGAKAIRLRLQNRSAKVRWLPGIVVAAAAVAMTLTMNFGAPSHATASQSSERFVDCRALDWSHNVTIIDRAHDGRCRPVTTAWPYVAPLKMYYEAKRAALVLYKEHPWFGVGEVRFGELARTAFVEAYGLASDEDVVLYRAPHSLYLGVAASSGTLGVVALLVLVMCLLRTYRGVSTRSWRHAYFAATVGFLLIGINIDILEIPYAWYALGLFMGAALADLTPNQTHGLSHCVPRFASHQPLHDDSSP